jgi:membrane protease YdiL (CAAX protease family)
MGGKRKSTGGRRRNYAPKPEEIGYRRYLPTGWANWLGFWLFGLVGIAVVVASVVNFAVGVAADGIAAGVIAVAMAYMTYLFGSTRLRT